MHNAQCTRSQHLISIAIVENADIRVGGEADVYKRQVKTVSLNRSVFVILRLLQYTDIF